MRGPDHKRHSWPRSSGRDYGDNGEHGWDHVACGHVCGVKQLYLVVGERAREVEVDKWPGAYAVVGGEEEPGETRRLWQIGAGAEMVDRVWEEVERLEFIAVEWTHVHHQTTHVLMRRERFGADQLEKGLIRGEWARPEWARYEWAAGEPSSPDAERPTE